MNYDSIFNQEIKSFVSRDMTYEENIIEEVWDFYIYNKTEYTGINKIFTYF